MENIDTYWQMKANKPIALMLAKRQIPEFVQDAIGLEGIIMTLPEIQTILDGISVGGHKISDQNIAVNQGNAWRLLFDWIEKDVFEVTAEKVCQLHDVAAKEDALAWGQFRYQNVSIAGTEYKPPKAEHLPQLFDKMIEEAVEYPDIYDRAIFVFLTMARHQFFFDVNKRMGRFMMNGILLSAGFPAINIPVKKQLKFNQLMLDFYKSNKPDGMNLFLRSCLSDRTINIMKEKPAIEINRLL